MKRIIVAIAGIPLISLACWQGGWWLAGLVIVLQSLALLEWKGICAKFGWRTNLVTIFPVIVFTDLVAAREFDARIVAVFVLLLVALLITELFDRSRTPLFGIAAASSFLIYVAVPFALWIVVRNLPVDGRYGNFGPLLALIIATWLCDSGAYYVGRSIGRTKLFVSASPNKTWEGFVGGFVFAALLLPLLGSLGLASPTVSDFIALPLIVGVLGQIGDLLESMIKRQAQLKDSSGLLPGHGGILDRFDSLLISTPAFLAYLMLFPS